MCKQISQNSKKQSANISKNMIAGKKTPYPTVTLFFLTLNKKTVTKKCQKKIKWNINSLEGGVLHINFSILTEHLLLLMIGTSGSPT